MRPKTPRKEHINIKIDSELKRRLKVHCASNGITIQDFVTELIEAAITLNERDHL